MPLRPGKVGRPLTDTGEKEEQVWGRLGRTMSSVLDVMSLKYPWAIEVQMSGSLAGYLQEWYEAGIISR